MSPNMTTAFAPVSYHDLHTVSNRSCTDYAMGVKDARTMVERLQSADLTPIAEMMRVNRDRVRAEFDIMAARKAANPVYHAQCCVVFALLSPQMAFTHNVELAQAVMIALPALHTHQDVAAVMFVTRKDGQRARFNGWVTKTETITAALPFLQALTPADMTRDNLLALRGMAGKTSAMAMALWNEHAGVFTLDIWMFRLTRELLGDDVAVKFSAAIPAYKILEAAWVAWAKTLEASVFEVQWTLWNCTGFGRHVSHLGIFGYNA